MQSQAREAAQAQSPMGSPVDSQSLEKVREDAERAHILSVLRMTDGNRGRAARVLGISRKTLWKKLKHLGVSWPPDATER